MVEYGVSLAYQPRVASRTTTVAGTLHSLSTVDWIGYHVTIGNPARPTPFRSGPVAVNAKGMFSAEIEVEAYRTSRFTMDLTDGAGGGCRLSPNTFSITHGDVLLTHSLGIQLHDREFAPIVPKATPLPRTHTEKFATAEALRDEDTAKAIRIPVVQGERRRADRNHEVGVLQIQARDLRVDLPKGSEVEVTFTVTESTVLSVVADVPLLGLRVAAEFDLSQPRAHAPEVLEVLLIEAQKRLGELRADAAHSGSLAAKRVLAELDEENAVGIARWQVVAARVDPSVARCAEERLRDIQAQLDDVEDAMGITKQAQDLQELITQAERLSTAHGAAVDRHELAMVTARARDAIRDQDAAAIRAQTERAVELVVELERRAPDWPVKLFHAALGNVPASGEATRLINEGDRAVRSGDMGALADVNRRLLRLCAPRRRSENTGSLGVVRP